MMTDKAPADSNSAGVWRMVTSGRKRVEHRSFLQLSVTHMKCKKWVMRREFHNDYSKIIDSIE